MTDAVHTPGPTEARVLSIRGGGGFGDTIAHCGGVLHPVARRADEAVANARRLSACWNALEGISTADIEAGVVKELVEALTLIEDGRLPNGFTATWGELREIARNALAKIGGAS